MLQEHSPATGQSSDRGRTNGKASRASHLLSIVCGLAALAVLLVGYGAYESGLLGNMLFVLLPTWVLGMIVTRLWAAYCKRLQWGLFWHPLRRDLRPYLLQCLNRWAFWVLTAVTLHFVITTFGASPDDLRVRQVQLPILVCTKLLMLLALVPPKRTRLTTNLLYTIGWVFLSVELLRIVQAPVAGVTLDVPFRGEWYVAQGGRSTIINHHYSLGAQRDALDMLVAQEGSTFQGDPLRLESYFAFGQRLYAPADGTVVRVVDDRPDMPIGHTDAAQPAGNYLVIDIGQERFVMLGHLRQNSIQVSEGSVVKRGQAIAQSGNSGNTSEPHLHMQVQNRADFYDPQLQTYPILFEDVTRVRDGLSEQFRAADVRRDDQLVAAE